MIMQQFADRLGFGKELSKNYKMQKVKGMDEPVPDDILREINKCCWTIGYTGQSPERLQAHMRNMGAFDVRTLKAKGSVKDKVNGYDIAGDYFGLPWPCYGTPELKHPGSPNLYDTSQARDGRRRQLPRELRRGAQRQEPAGRGRIAFARRRHHDRLPGTRPPAAQEARLVGRTHRGRESPRPRARTGRPTVRAA